MRFLIQCTLLTLLIMYTCSLTCRSEHGPKDDELRKIYNNCLKQQEGSSNENTQKGTEKGWTNRGNNPRNQWERDSESEEKEGRLGNRNKTNKEKARDQQVNGRIDNRQSGMSDTKGTDGIYSTNGGRNNRMDQNNMGNNNNRGRNDNYGGIEHLRSQDEFLQSEEYGDVAQNNYYSNLKPPRRYKREKHTEINSGQRSQYNPHYQRSNGNGNDHGQEAQNSSNNSSKENDKACVLHCFMESLHMTSESGMPDRYLVTHALTKDEKNEDLRDFLQESIEECFQILQNENTEDKCEFSKNLLTCLSEKGRANCDDWNGKPSFLF